MKTTNPSAIVFLAVLTFLGIAQPARAQTGWGNALSFDGVNDYVQSQQDVALANRSFSVEAWVQRRSSSTMDMVVSQGGGVYNQCLMFGFHYYGGNQFVFDFYGNGVGSGTAETDTAWHHWAGTYDASTKVRCLYRDGVLIASNTNTVEHYQGAGSLKIGIGPGGEAPNEFDGSIDEVRIWGVARSAAELSANMNGRLTGAEAGLLAYWRFDEGTGTVAYDASANHRDSVLVNGPVWTRSGLPQTPSDWGMALSLNGTSAHVLSDQAIPLTDSSLTIEAWARRDGTGRDCIVGQGTGQANLGLFFGFRDGNQFAMDFWNNDIVTTNTYTDSGWHHWAGTYDAATKERRLYRDGVIISALTNTSAPHYQGTGQLVIGSFPNRSDWNLAGNIDEVRIWTRARRQAEIQATMGRPLTGAEPGLSAYYRFDERAGIAAYDASPNHRNGGLLNRPVRIPSTVPPPPVITLFGANPMTNEYSVPFVDPGATAGAGPGSISAASHNLVLKADGSVVDWGDNSFGQTGFPVGTANVVGIAAGFRHSLALKANGTVVGWGYNLYGQADGAKAGSSVVAIAVGDSHSLALRADGSVIGWGAGTGNTGTWPDLGQAQIPAGASSGVVAITAGYAHSLALKADGSVEGWGTVGSPPSPINTAVAIAAGGSHSLALKADGSIVAWGNNSYGQTNVPPHVTNVVAIAAGSYHSLALKADGSVVAWGFNDNGQTDVPDRASSGVVAIAGGYRHSLALKADGSLVSWGRHVPIEMPIPRIERVFCSGIGTSGTVNVNMPGTYELTYRVTNVLGIVGTAIRTVKVVPDSTLPELPTEVVLAVSPGSCQAALTVAATDTSDPAPLVTSLPPQGTRLPSGRTNVLCITTDASGNCTTGAVPVYVVHSSQRLAPVGEIWTQRLALNNSNRVTVASATDGTRLVVAEQGLGGRIYTSTDGGATWSPRRGGDNWRSVASSADGTRLVAVEYGFYSGGLIYTSSNAGTNWALTSAPRAGWVSVASSADGTKLAAVQRWMPGGDGNGHIYVSANAGTNWAETSAPAALFLAVASSPDGTRLIGIEDSTHRINTSTDAGVTWATTETAGALYVSWSAAAFSGDGTRLVACERGGLLYTSSDSGATWIPRESRRNWVWVATSADGTKLVAADMGTWVRSGSDGTGEYGGYDEGQIYISKDSGATWSPCATRANWSSVASSGDGNRLLAGTYDGRVYTSAPSLVGTPPLAFIGATNRAVALAGPAGTVVAFSLTAAATNGCGSAVPVTCIPPSGSAFPAGTNWVTCVAVDVFGVTNATTFLVDVRSTQPPTDITLSHAPLPENLPAGTTVGTFSVMDPEPGDAIRLSLVGGDGDADNGWFTIVGNHLQTAAILSYESKSSYNIRVRALDSGDLSVDRVFTITITNVNDAPVLDIARTPALDPVGIRAEAAVGAVGTPISSLVDIGGPLSNVTDDDGGAVAGLAIVSAVADTNYGAWCFTTNGGTTWTNLVAPSESNALLLSAAAGNRVYFQPHTNFIGTVPAALAFRAWDQTSGSNGGSADTTSNGWTTAFSADMVTADVSVGWGWAMSFDGVDDYLHLTNGVYFQTNFTIEAWVYPRANSRWARVLDCSNTNTASGIKECVVLTFCDESGLRPHLRVGTNLLTADKPLQLNQWVHLVATVDGTTGILYSNGVAIATGTMSVPVNVVRTNARLAASNSPGEPNANVMLDEIRIWNVARSREQITNTMLTTLAGNEPGLVGYYRFGEGKGLAASDATPNHLDGSLINRPAWVHSTVPVCLTPVDSTSGNTRFVQGYWPNGVTNNAISSVPNLVVGGISAGIKPASSTPGVKSSSQGSAGANGASHYYNGDSGTFGNPGATVSVTFDGGGYHLNTSGSNAPGVLAQSVGGKGGNGGRGSAYVLGAGFGGNGALGGNGGNVSINSGGKITNSGDSSPGILALSVAGAGGNGGDGKVYGFGVGYGGSGGRGGNGGTAQVGGDGAITTLDHDSSGVLAISRGGKGGAGGEGSCVGKGGSGGAGGSASNVLVSGSWNITTHGTNAHGIAASSLGGSGGTSGSGGWIAGGSGTGGASGNGGNTKVDFKGGSGDAGGTIETFGKDSHGIFAQSIGGFAGSGASGGSVFASAGGDGGSAGNGGSASIVNSGSVTTHGARANALFAESVGGGGGSSGSGSGWFGGVAGQSKAGGHAGAVSVANSGEARTYDNEARGIFAQSVGGSGGNSGVTVGLLVSIGGSGGDGGNGSTVTVDNTGLVETAGSDSSAIFAQSTGGGGGSGGGSGSAGLFGSLAVGGTGGGGGDGGRVIVKSGTNSITTAGTNSHGVFAQSVGGGGGKGGFAIAGSVGLGGSESIGLGGTGGDGGSANDVVVTSGSTITTQGTNAHGIFAQSVGGGGGEGGFTIAASGSDTYAGTINIGGKGGKGGSSDSVAVTNTGVIITSGRRSYGVLAQSVGGGGGEGGFSLGISGSGTASLPLSFGGSGGDGGNGSLLRVNNLGSIRTEGSDSHGLFVQSVGGGGGSGGFSSSLSGSGTFAGAFSMGGSGGKGGNSDAVNVASSGEITTAGDRAYGILAQSIGGGGGDGGFSIAASGSGNTALAASFGGSGGIAGDGNVVNLESASRIATAGSTAHGIFAQSVGGGGGSGGFSVAVTGAGTFGGSLSLGGEGSAGGDGDAVTVNSRGQITTEGDRSYGILAQSVGGGGGDGGFSIAGAASGKAAAALSMGGSGSGGGLGGNVAVNSGSLIATEGKNAHGIFAQSVGGGGGSGGFSIAGAASSDGGVSATLGGSAGGGARAGNVSVTTSNTINTAGEHAYGVLAQSVGGGGGDGGFSVAGGVSKGPSVNLAMGGSGGSGGTGGNVDIAVASSVTTTGADAHAVFAQSVGGGGGSGGFSVAGGISVDNVAVSASMGGFGASGADAGDVAVAGNGTLHTSGNHAYGILAQSVGGGGGDGGFSVAGSLGKGASVGLSVGGFGDDGGLGGRVAVNSSGNIVTEGELAYGIFAQSVGGGGGSGGFSVAAAGSADSASVALGLGGFGGAGSDADRVALQNSGSIETMAQGSHAIVAQSVGGGGGAGGFAGTVAGSMGDKANVSAAIGGKGAIGGSASNVTVLNSGALRTRADGAYGVFAQSVGGGGGDGGFGLSVALGAKDKAVGLSVAIGGGGGAGGKGAAVAVDNLNQIETSGEKSHGILAQSIGGGGGNGGFSVAGALSKSTNANQLAVSIGGGGGDGNVAGLVTVSNSARIATLGKEALGIEAQSIGGGGGNGGLSFAGTFAGGDSKSLSLALGGAGGSGNKGSTVNVDNGGIIETTGESAHGILAQSIGGGGGIGGMSISSNRTGSASLAFSLGGSGGDGGVGGAVDVENRGSVVTRGVGANGVFAQSVGGGGGAGGASLTGSKGGSDFSLSLALGGVGGSGNTGGLVTVANSGSIETTNQRSHGIFAQSVGGGGGRGGDSDAAATGMTNISLTLALGGNGGTNSAGGNVVITNTGQITTRARDSYGVYAQSVGGGGGEGGSSSTTSEAGDDSSQKSLSLSLSLGGKGGAGNTGGAVTVSNDGGIDTYGNGSHGVFAQSVGAGGGAGGGGETSTSADQGMSLDLALGGKGGAAGDGGALTLVNGGDIATRGNSAHGIVAQSIGGGGGMAGDAVSPGSGSTNLSLSLALGGQGGSSGNGGVINVTSAGTISTAGRNSHGVLAQSVGGGGGAGGNASGEGDSSMDFGLLVGGQGGSSGGGGDVSVDNTGVVTTSAAGSFGILAQSVGGGGGAGGAGAMDLSGGTIGIGGAGGSAGDGGNVAVTQRGDIDTSGAAAQGIFAQSVGGGGGVAGSLDGGLGALSEIGLVPSLAQAGGSAGDGGHVSVESSGAITTEGTAANGIFAQSVGGGGGLGGGGILGIGFAGSVGGAGNGGAVNIAHDGDASTHGDAAHGIFAQSVGGTNGRGGSVSVEVTGDITALGEDSVGIFAQSTGDDGGGNITINIHTNATVHGGSGASAGVRIEDGAVNALINCGTITTLDGTTGVAIRGGDGNETVENYGTLIGQVDLGGGVNVWNNHPGSIFNVATTFSLGAGNTMNNYGMLRGSGQIVGNVLNAGSISPGNSAGTLTIDGSLSLQASTKMTLEIGGRQQGASYDFVKVTEGVNFDGTLSLSLVNNFRPSSTDTFTLMEYASLIGMFSNAQGGTRIPTSDNLASFEISYTSTNLVASAYQSPDTDGDGMTDYDEHLAGTDWTNSTSVLMIKSLTKASSGHFVLSFVSVTNKNYVIDYSTNLDSSVWWTVPASNVTFPSANTGQWVDDGTLTGGTNSTSRFYRVRLLLD